MKSQLKFDATTWLRKNKLRATSARISIIDLLDASPVPLTLADIQEKIKGEGCDFATVFRFITILEEKGLVDKMPWMDGSTRHEIRDREGTDHHHHHHYLICRTCQKIEPINECVVERLENRVAKEKGYASVSHSLQLSGVCPSCQKSTKKPNER